MTSRDQLRQDITALFRNRVATWATQGRSPEHCWAVENFYTGQGELLVDDLVDLFSRLSK